MRMPGGSWSNGYDWRACEVDLATGCWGGGQATRLYWIPASRACRACSPSIRGTSEEAAALVAFFNGAVDDDQVIGVDVHGRVGARSVTGLDPYGKR